MWKMSFVINLILQQHNRFSWRRFSNSFYYNSRIILPEINLTSKSRLRMYFFFIFNFIRFLYKFLPLSRVRPITLWAGGPEVSALEEQAEGRGFEPRSNREKFQTISTPSSYSTRPGLSKKWTGRRLVTDSGTKCAWVMHESRAVQTHVHNTFAASAICLGCLVALTICRTTTTVCLFWRHHENMPI